eukprot:m.80372 g.80372  ORF g.80372 m.80372 type:complete len:312 (+) comp8038_c0_seq1:123-1058(+)
MVRQSNKAIPRRGLVLEGGRALDVGLEGLRLGPVLEREDVLPRAAAGDAALHGVQRRHGVRAAAAHVEAVLARVLLERLATRQPRAGRLAQRDILRQHGLVHRRQRGRRRGPLGHEHGEHAGPARRDKVLAGPGSSGRGGSGRPRECGSRDYRGTRGKGVRDRGIAADCRDTPVGLDGRGVLLHARGQGQVAQADRGPDIAQNVQLLVLVLDLEVEGLLGLLFAELDAKHVLRQAAVGQDVVRIDRAEAGNGDLAERLAGALRQGAGQGRLVTQRNQKCVAEEKEAGALLGAVGVADAQVDQADKEPLRVD